MAQRTKVGAGVLGLGLLLSGCAAGGSAIGAARVAPLSAGEESVLVLVENSNALDASLYVLSDGHLARRMGDVPGNGSTRSFVVPWTFAQDMAFRIELVAGGTCVTAPVVVGPGEAVDLRIVPDARMADCR